MPLFRVWHTCWLNPDKEYRLLFTAHMKSFLNIRLLILSFTILGSGYLFYTAANCPDQAEQKAPRPVMPSIISPFAQSNLLGMVRDKEADVEKAYVSAFALSSLSEVKARLY